MSIVARADGAWRLIDCKENSGVYVRDAGEWISLCPDEPEVLSPFELITGYTIEHVGTSASLVGGQVQFEGVTKLSLNNVFSSEFRNYVVSFWMDPVGADDAAAFYYRLRAAGKDNSTASSYTYQRIYVTGPSVSAARNSSDKANFAYVESAANGYQQNIYGPYLAQPTASRSISVADTSGAGIYEWVSTHNQSTSYDGITFLTDTSNNATSGALQVYGVRS